MVEVIETKTKSVTPAPETLKHPPGQDDEYVVKQEVTVKVEDDVELSKVARVVGEAIERQEDGFSPDHPSDPKRRLGQV